MVPRNLFNLVKTVKSAMWYKNFNFCQIQELLSKSSYILHKIHSHSHLILDPESAFYDHFESYADSGSRIRWLWLWIVCKMWEVFTKVLKF